MSNVIDKWLEAQIPAAPAKTAQPLPWRLGQAQYAALRQTLTLARERSAFYRQHWGQLSDLWTDRQHLPSTTASTTDTTPPWAGLLSQLPFTTAAHLARWEDFLCVSRGEVARMVTLSTSGTTGTPKRLAFTEQDLLRTVDFFRTGMAQIVGPGQTLLVLLPGAQRPNGVADLLRQALPHSRVVPADECSPEEALCRHRPHAVVGTPGQLGQLLPLRGHAATTALSLGGILSSAEPLPPPLAQLLHKAFDCVVLDHYGLTETCYGGGVQCLARQGYHMRALDVLVEIVDPVTGNPVPTDGNPRQGEVVITTLHREAMPLIRYRTGDVASLLHEPCACGSCLPRLSRVAGRVKLNQDRTAYTVVCPPKGMGRFPSP